MFVSQTSPNIPETPSMEAEYEIVAKDRVPIRLGSIRELRDEVMETAHNGSPWEMPCLILELTELFANHTFVGILDGWRRLATIQHGVKLYLVDYGAVWYFTRCPVLTVVMNSFIKLVSRNLEILGQ